ncbi:MAG: nuclear transport factor 2 family protein [Acidimicrobiales bacterium]|jgi:ketosteroid isomerase-like protein
MYKALIRSRIRRSVQALGDGDPGPLLAGFADDAVLVFPGTSTWAGEYRGKRSIEGFLRRFLDAGLVGETHDIVVNGPPWRTTVCVLFVDRAADVDGEVVYENRVMFLVRAVWGKVVYQEDFLDTQRVTAFDAYLSRT